MRPIKFRAWDEDRKKMIIDFIVERGMKPSPYLDNEGQLVKPASYTLMQYTGLKDRQGKEIFEGDVIKMDGWEPKNYEVGFREGGFCFYTPGAMSTDINMIESSEGIHATVVGNIYEHSHLLKGNGVQQESKG